MYNINNPINVKNYGDIDAVRNDAKTISDILGRQGIPFALDCIAECIGKTSLLFSFTENENMRILHTTLEDLKSAILERT